jgi:hypothetical protein
MLEGRLRWSCFFAVVFATRSVDIVVADLGGVQNEDRHLVAIQAHGADPTDRYPLARCQGDCDLDSHCRGILICFQRGRYEPVPGCQGGRNDRTPSDYCVDPSDMIVQPKLNFLGTNPSREDFPLQGKVEGCRIDSAEYTVACFSQ